MKQPKTVYSLIPPEDFKEVLRVDDHEDPLARFCLIIASHTIEQHCMRRLLRKRHFERIGFSGDLLLSLKEYPVTEVLALYAIQREQGNGELIEPEFFSVIPDCGTDYDLPSTLSLSPVVKRLRHIDAIRVVYWAGYSSSNFASAKLAAGKAPANLASACLELASWNMARYQWWRIGMTGSVRGQGKEGEHFMVLPARVF